MPKLGFQVQTTAVKRIFVIRSMEVGSGVGVVLGCFKQNFFRTLFSINCLANFNEIFTKRCKCGTMRQFFLTIQIMNAKMNLIVNKAIVD